MDDAVNNRYLETEMGKISDPQPTSPLTSDAIPDDETAANLLKVDREEIVDWTMNTDELVDFVLPFTRWRQSPVTYVGYGDDP